MVNTYGQYRPYVYLQAAVKKLDRLSTKQKLITQNALSNLASDYPEEFPELLPTILGGKGTKDMDNPHLDIIRKYALLLSLMS